MCGCVFVLACVTSVQYKIPCALTNSAQSTPFPFFPCLVKMDPIDNTIVYLSARRVSIELRGALSSALGCDDDDDGWDVDGGPFVDMD